MPWGGCAALHRHPAPAPLLQLHPPSLPPSMQPPRALLQETLAHLGPGSGTQGSQHPQPPLPAALSGRQPHGALGWETGITGREWGCWQDGLVWTAAMGLYQPCALVLPQITHNRSRVDEYLLQSLPYLKDPQATVREAAVRFIGESPGTHFWPSGPSPQWWGSLGVLLGPRALGSCPCWGTALPRGSRALMGALCPRSCCTAPEDPQAGEAVGDLPQPLLAEDPPAPCSKPWGTELMSEFCSPSAGLSPGKDSSRGQWDPARPPASPTSGDWGRAARNVSPGTHQ